MYLFRVKLFTVLPAGLGGGGKHKKKHRAYHSWQLVFRNHPWNPADFTRDFTGGFHPWNLADFTQISCEIYPKPYNKQKLFSLMNTGWGLWPRISWNPPDFTLKSSGFHLWNLADFTQISPVKSTQNYKSKCFSKNSFSLMNAGWGISP